MCCNTIYGSIDLVQMNSSVVPLFLGHHIQLLLSKRVVSGSLKQPWQTFSLMMRVISMVNSHHLCVIPEIITTCLFKLWANQLRPDVRPIKNSQCSNRLITSMRGLPVKSSASEGILLKWPSIPKFLYWSIQITRNPMFLRLRIRMFQASGKFQYLPCIVDCVAIQMYLSLIALGIPGVFSVGRTSLYGIGENRSSQKPCCKGLLKCCTESRQMILSHPSSSER